MLYFNNYWSNYWGTYEVFIVHYDLMSKDIKFTVGCIIGCYTAITFSIFTDESVFSTLFCLTAYIQNGIQKIPTWLKFIVPKICN
jgi:hypothetical protein